MSLNLLTGSFLAAFVGKDFCASNLPVAVPWCWTAGVVLWKLQPVFCSIFIMSMLFTIYMLRRNINMGSFYAKQIIDRCLRCKNDEKIVGRGET